MESSISLAEDSMLGPEILPRAKAGTTRLREASSVLITGTTGFLGSFLLDQLLRTTGQDTRFYCLVRDRDPGQGNPPTGCWRPLSSMDLKATPPMNG